MGLAIGGGLVVGWRDSMIGTTAASAGDALLGGLERMAHGVFASTPARRRRQSADIQRLGHGARWQAWAMKSAHFLHQLWPDGAPFVRTQPKLLVEDVDVLQHIVPLLPRVWIACGKLGLYLARGEAHRMHALHHLQHRGPATKGRCGSCASAPHHGAVDALLRGGNEDTINQAVRDLLSIPRTHSGIPPERENIRNQPNEPVKLLFGSAPAVVDSRAGVRDEVRGGPNLCSRGAPTAWSIRWH